MKEFPSIKVCFILFLCFSQTQLTHSLHLIGPLKFYNGWVCCHGNKLQLLNPHRVEETLLYRDLLEKHVVPMTRLENPIRLTERYSVDVHMCIPENLDWFLCNCANEPITCL